MNGTLVNAWGYQGDNMRLPVKDVETALPFYERVLGFRIVSRSSTPHNSAVLARDQVQLGLAENGGDPTQDGCAFHVKDLQSLFAEFRANGLQKELPDYRRRATRRPDVAGVLRGCAGRPVLRVRRAAGWVSAAGRYAKS